MNKLTWKKIGWSLGAVGALAVAAACSSSSGGGDGGINCGTGSTQCGDTCTVVARDSQNCGACGKACAATELCSAGTCVPAAGGCTMGTTKCGTECVDTKTDDRNCGMCGTKCGANKVCMAGACADNCAMGTTKCGNSCVDQQTDRTNCGGCGTTCKDGEICSAGKCAISCQQGLTKCNWSTVDGGAAEGGIPDGGLAGDFCTNLQTDNQNCGACGVICGGIQKCVAGACVTPQISSALLYGGVPANYITDVKNGLVATGSFKVVDTINGQAATPTLQTLKAYDSILVLTDSGGFAGNAATVGDVVADYFDQGGQVVVATFANASIAITGKFGTVNNGYMLIQPAGQTQPTETLALQIVDPQSPLVYGVSKLTATSAYRSTGTLVNGGTAVAKWGSGANLIVKGVVKGRNRVDLNMYPPSAVVLSGGWVGDGFWIMRNALLYR